MAASRAPTASPRDRLPSTLDPPTRPRFWQRSGAREETGLGPKPDLRPSNKYKPHPLRPEVKAGKPSSPSPDPSSSSPGTCSTTPPPATTNWAATTTPTVSARKPKPAATSDNYKHS